MKQSLSVIIPTKNRENDLLITLTALSQGGNLPDEIIIIDQTMESIEENLKNNKDISRLNIRYFHEPDINGLIEARIAGINRTVSNIIVLLDDDITVPTDFLTKIFQLFKSYPKYDAFCSIAENQITMPLLGVIVPSIFRIGPFWDNRLIVAKFHYLFNKPVRTTKFSAGYMICKREVFETVGLDRNLKGHPFVGDIDFSYRASKKYNLAIAPNLQVIHRDPMVKLYDKKTAETKRVKGRLYFFKKNVDKTLINYVCFSWFLFGTLVGAIYRSITSISQEPLQGFLAGLIK